MRFAMRLLKNKSRVFGQNIAPDCAYCANGAPGGCLKSKEMKDGRCAAFDYDPLRRRPRIAPPLPVPDAKGFEV